MSSGLHAEGCRCCEGLDVLTPAVIDNPPALPAIRYRTGTHGSFRETMLARLTRRMPEPRPDVRAEEDFTTALVDAFATVADVLTFYQERIANESYLRTATERVSILQLARTIGYELKPGVAASVALAFRIDEPPPLPPNLTRNADIVVPVPRATPIAKGTRVQSLPRPGENAQTFETVEDIVAFPDWNAILPRLHKVRPQPESPVDVAGKLEVRGGDLIVIESAGKRAICHVTEAAYDEDADLTTIKFTLEEDNEIGNGVRDPGPQFTPIDLTTAPHALDAATIQKMIGNRWTTADLTLIAAYQSWDLDALESALRVAAVAWYVTSARVFVFPLRASIFGYNAPALEIQEVREQDGEITAKAKKSKFDTASFDHLDEQPGADIPAIDLDTTYPKIAKESLVILRRPETRANDPTGANASLAKLYQVSNANETTRVEASMSGKCTRLALRPDAVDEVVFHPNVKFDPFSLGSSKKFSARFLGFSKFNTSNAGSDIGLDRFFVRTTTVHAQSTPYLIEPLTLTDVVDGKGELTLDGVFIRLRKGQSVAISGEETDSRGTFSGEVAVLKSVEIEGAFTIVTFENQLLRTYTRSTVRINANVAAATHGEGVEEVLGSGDAAAMYQSFTLRQPPLTHVKANTPSGRASTLEVWVDDVLWSEVPTLFGRGAEERVYIARLNDDGTTTITFGDGISGARLPTGQENVRAKYRKGIGLPGNLEAEQVSLLISRPQGLKSAKNPMASTGGDDPESRDAARQNAPLTVLTLDRVVSLQDFEDFARGFAGVAKSIATWSTGGERRGVFVTVAGPNGVAVDDTTTLATALRTYGDPYVPIRVVSYRRTFFRVAAEVVCARDRDPEIVKTAIETKLRSAFSFDARSFGQPVFLSEVTALLHSVEGVVSARVTSLETDAQTEAPLLAEVPAGQAAATSEGAQLLLLDPRPITLTVTKEA
ncbi:MAG TPA: putative baseplate assembly protein [Thermoanaerobaculia bacterium]|nr:putative baseplate assembly protein [Thermoanaerobaculia bacterium]